MREAMIFAFIFCDYVRKEGEESVRREGQTLTRGARTRGAPTLLRGHCPVWGTARDGSIPCPWETLKFPEDMSPSKAPGRVEKTALSLWEGQAPAGGREGRDSTCPRDPPD